jgi:exopolyphosphatase/pppGpp-phosphohydrolase
VNDRAVPVRSRPELPWERQESRPPQEDPDEILGLVPPDPRTPVAGGFLLARVFEEAGLPPGVLHVLPMTASELEAAIVELRRQIRAAIARDAGHLLRNGPPDRAAATSKTFRSLARICGAAPSDAGPLVPRSLDVEVLRAWIPKLVALPAEELSDLPGVSSSRTHQIVPGALVAEACMDIFDLPALEICPWALREGLILERLDRISVLA